MTIEFLITTLIVVVSPGTGVLYTLAAGLSRGSRASVVAAFGCTLGIVPHMAAAILGLAALLHTSALAFQTLKWLGVAYLLFMAWQALREHGALKVEQEVGARSDLGVIVHAILINVLNPKLSIFFFAFLPQFVPTDEAAPLERMLLLSGIFMLLTFVVFVGYGLFAASIRNRVISRRRVRRPGRQAGAGRAVEVSQSFPAPWEASDADGARVLGDSSQLLLHPSRHFSEERTAACCFQGRKRLRNRCGTRIPPAK